MKEVKTPGFPATILCMHFRLGNEPVVYRVGGIKGGTNELFLQAIETEEIRKISAEEFKRLAVSVSL